MPLTLQDIFNAAWKAFIVEGKPPGREDGTIKVCRYRTSDGRHCAIGHALPDWCDDALKSEEAFDTLPDTFPELFANDVKRLPMFRRRDFQKKLHDAIIDENGEFFTDIKERYIRVAEEFKLTVPDEMPPHDKGENV